MRIIDDLIASLKGDAILREVRVCAFWTAVVLDDGRCGLASTLRPDEPQCAGPAPLVPQAGHLLECTALELAQYAQSESLLEASIGMAAINALLEVDESRCVELNAEEVILKQGTGKKVFGPSKAETMAAQLGVPLLGRLPIDPQIAQLCDEGRIEEYRSDNFAAIAQRLAESAPKPRTSSPIKRTERR